MKKREMYNNIAPQTAAAAAHRVSNNGAKEGIWAQFEGKRLMTTAGDSAVPSSQINHQRLHLYPDHQNDTTDPNHGEQSYK